MQKYPGGDQRMTHENSYASSDVKNALNHNPGKS